jgi:hypothetical protein
MHSPGPTPMSSALAEIGCGAERTGGAALSSLRCERLETVPHTRPESYGAPAFCYHLRRRFFESRPLLQPNG